MFTVAPGDVRTISSLQYYPLHSAEDGKRTLVNENWQLVVELEFTNGSRGIFITTSVPEPGCAAILAVLTSSFLTTRRAAASRRRTFALFCAR
jgi:hypothetical protein